MGVYNYLLTTKTIRVKTAEGRETINLMSYISKESSSPVPAWEQALICRMDDLWRCRDFPKYVTGDNPEDNWTVYERIEASSFTDHYPSTRILAGYLRRGEGKMFHFEKWSRLKVLVSSRDFTAQNEINGKLRESGLMGEKWSTSTFRDDTGEEYVIVYARDEADITRAALVLAGEYTFSHE